jgi:DNA ligase 1
MDTSSLGPITLYRKHSGGNIGTWTIRVAGTDLVYGHAVVAGGSVSEFRDPIVTNSSGRGFEQQARLELESRVRRMRQRGYKDTVAEAQASNGGNQYGYAMPMLAHPITRVNVVPTARMWSQPKFNGHRALTVFDERHRMYSRKGTTICGVGSVDHIMETLHRVVPPDLALDGELYIHGMRLQRIASLIKAKQAESAGLTYVMYDLVMAEPYSTRLEVLRDIGRLLEQANPAISVSPTREIDCLDDAFRDFRHWRNAQYEGSMLRLDGRVYQAGVRSSSILKLKEREDGEFPIVGVTKTKIGANVVLRAPNGKTFETPAPGTHAEKAAYLTDETIWKGKTMTCEWAEWTADGLPFHCVAMQIREDV